MSSNADKLKALRYTLGLTQSQMAEKIGVSEASIEHYENGLVPLGKVKTPAQYKIKAFLEVQDISPSVIAESKKVLELEERQKRVQRHFIEGRCYKIYGSGYSGFHGNSKASAGLTTANKAFINLYFRKGR